MLAVCAHSDVEDEDDGEIRGARIVSGVGGGKWQDERARARTRRRMSRKKHARQEMGWKQPQCLCQLQSDNR